MLKHALIILALTFPAISMACEEHAGHMEGGNFAKVDVISTPSETSNTAKIRLSEAATGKPISLTALKLVHTKHLHLMIIDPTLKDYHHIHPVETKTKGVYEFKLKPSESGYYRAFADITPLATDKQEYINFVIGRENRKMPLIDKTENLEVNQNGLNFKLSFDTAPMAGKMAMGTISVSKDGKEFKDFEEVMGAYSHIAAFSRNGHNLEHIHPMEGSKEIKFHLSPQEAGFIKIFAQFRISGKDVYVLFGVVVKNSLD